MKLISSYISFISQVVFLLVSPICLLMISFWSGIEDSAHRSQIKALVEDIHYESKIMFCETLGQEKAIRDCKKGMFQNMSLSYNLDLASEASIEKGELYILFIYITSITASIFCLMKFIEERKGANPKVEKEQLKLVKEINILLEEKNQKLIEKNIQLEKILILHGIKTEERKI